MSNSSILHLYKALSSATTPDLSGPGCDGDEEFLHFSQISRTEASPLDGLITYLWYLLGRSINLCRDAVLQTQLTGLEIN